MDFQKLLIISWAEVPSEPASNRTTSNLSDRPPIHGLIPMLIETPVPFDFLIDGQFLRTSIVEYLTANATSLVSGDEALRAAVTFDVDYLDRKQP